MPLFHVHGLVASTLAQLAAGGTVVVPRRFSPRRFQGQARGACGHLAVRRADAAPDDPRRTPPQPSPTMRFLRSCSSALPLQLMREAEARYGVPMVEAYGMTEATHQMTSNPLPPGGRGSRLGGGFGGR